MRGMESTSHSAQTTARATASLASARALLKRLNAQRTALLAHEAAVLVHSIAVQNLADYPAAATITFSSNHPTSLTMERVLDADGNVLRDATDEIVFEITEALQETSIAELVRAASNDTFAAHGIHATVGTFDGVITGHIDLLAAAAAFPELPETLQEAQTRPLTEAEQAILVSDARELQGERQHRLSYISDVEEYVSVRVNREATDAVLSDRFDGEHLIGDWLVRTVGQAVPGSVKASVCAVELIPHQLSWIPVRLVVENGQTIEDNTELIRQMIEEDYVVERLDGLVAGVSAAQLAASEVAMDASGLTVRFD